MRAIVTAGGTREPIDDVRVVTNLSRGRFGATIANALAERAVEVTLLASAELAGHPDWLDDRVQVVRFSSFNDLAQALDEAIGDHPPDLLFMVAAISDYSPIPTTGKIRSTDDELVIHMRKNPKLLAALRQKCGVGSFLVGFKLLSGVSADELFRVAFDQVRKNRLNLTVANDLQLLSREYHPVQLVTPEGGRIDIDGCKAEVASTVVDFVIKRQQVGWSRSHCAALAKPTSRHEEAANLLRFAQEAALLPTTDGNITHRAEGHRFWATPRQVPKSEVLPDQLLYVEVEGKQVHYRGEAKASIDSAVHGWIYRRMPNIDGLLHFHDAIVINAVKTTFPYPCGTIEEGEEVYRCLTKAALTGHYSGGSFAVHLIHHGYLLGIEAGAIEGLAKDYRAAKSAWHAHMEDIKADPGVVSTTRITPVFDVTEVIGVLADFKRGLSVFLLNNKRGGGRGNRVIEALVERGRDVLAADECHVIDYYVERGFIIAEKHNGVAVLTPPSRRDDLLPMAFACLVNVCTNEVLLTKGRDGIWAMPGGKVYLGQSDLSAQRHLREVTSLEPPMSGSIKEFEVCTGKDDGAVAFRERYHLFPCLHCSEPAGESKWIALDDACLLRPMAVGTRRALRNLIDNGSVIETP